MKIKISKKQWDKIGLIRKSQVDRTQKVNELAQFLGAEVVTKKDHTQLILKELNINPDMIQKLAENKDLSPYITILGGKLVVAVFL